MQKTDNRLLPRRDDPKETEEMIALARKSVVRVKFRFLQYNAIAYS
jgi:hypothetical protein